jgi:hypothetical protein
VCPTNLLADFVSLEETVEGIVGHFKKPEEVECWRGSIFSQRQRAQNSSRILVRAESWRQEQLGDKPKRTWDEAALKWLTETSHKSTHEDDKSKVRWLQQYFSGRTLSIAENRWGLSRNPHVF